MIKRSILFINATELYVIKYLIETQKGRRIEQILFEHNHEPINDKIEDETGDYSIGQISYRRKEMRLEKCYKINLVLYNLFFILIAYSSYLSVNLGKNLNS